MRYALILIGFLSLNSLLAQSSWKEMMHDPNVNVYDVVQQAESYFENIDKTAKGSGWKKYQRWLYENEPKFYPTGDRSKSDPFFISNSFQGFLQTNSNTPEALFNNGWEEQGPYYIHQVTGHYAVGLGRVESFYADPNDTLRIYIGSRSGGFWKTTDGGLTWIGGSTDFLFASGVNSIAVSPSNPDSILINVRNASNGATHGIYRSIDEGNTWTLSNFNPINLGWGGLGSNQSINQVAYHPSAAGHIFIASSQGLFRSTDDLATWTIPVASGNFKAIAFHPTNPDIIYASTTNNSFIYVSINGGLTFNASNVISGNGSTIRLSTSAACPNCVFVGSTHGIWKSTDEGQNFSFIANPGISNYGAFAVSDVDTNYMLTGDIDVHMSSDHGNSFSKATTWHQGNANYLAVGTYVHADIRGSRCQNGVFWVNTDGFVCKSNDNGLTWQLFEGQSIRENYNLGLSQSNHDRTICGSQDNGTSIKTENSWIEFYGADGMEGIIHPLNDDWMIGSFQNGGRRRTKDGGLSQQGVTPSGQTGAWIAPLFYDPNDQMTVYHAGTYLYKSTDFGTTWTQLGSPGIGNISYATIAENNSDIIVVTKGANIRKSMDGGNTFVNIRSNLPNSSISDVAFDPNNDNTIVVTYASYQNNNSKVYISFDQGGTWQNITYNLNDMPIRAVVIDHTDASTIYLGGEIGVYKKAMSANSWTLYNPDLPNMSVRELEVMYGSNCLRAATWGRGLWEFTLDGRQSYPSILTTRITDQPSDEEPKFSVDQYVTSVISYDFTLDSVFVLWSDSVAVFDSLIPMMNTIDSTWVSQSPFPQYDPGTKMYFKVIAVGANNDTTETYKFMYTVQPFEYCFATGNSTNGNLYINNLSLSNINKSSGNNAYTYYKNSVIYLFVDSTYSISLTANTTWASNDCGAWIDFDRNAVFDPVESLGLPSFTGTSSQANFTVPFDANITDTLRLRARLSYYGTISSPCGNTLGEVEDYPVLLIDVPTPDFTISDPVTCQGEKIAIDYVGDAVDSVVWSFSNGINTISITAFNDSISFNESGMFDLKLVGYIHGFPFELDSANVVFVKPSDDIRINLSSCNSLDSGTVIQHLTNSFGCDSIITTHTELLRSDSISIDLSTCIPNDTGIVIQTLSNAYGCDSTISTTTNLLPSDSMTVNQVSCILNEIGASIQTLSNTKGCDSIVTTITDIGQISPNVSQSSYELTALPAGLEYQWLNCEKNNEIIAGETNQTFTATENGLYAVEITDGACIDTSKCVEVTSICDLGTSLLIYPNPTYNTLIIESCNKITLAEFRVYNEIGENVMGNIVITELGELKVMMDFTHVASGIYVIKTNSTSNKITKH